jgi:hypothetical protein
LSIKKILHLVFKLTSYMKDISNEPHSFMIISLHVPLFLLLFVWTKMSKAQTLKKKNTPPWHCAAMPLHPTSCSLLTPASRLPVSHLPLLHHIFFILWWLLNGFVKLTTNSGFILLIQILNAFLSYWNLDNLRLFFSSIWNFVNLIKDTECNSLFFHLPFSSIINM